MNKKINELTKLAKQLASKEADTPSDETSKEVLDALDSVAKLLEQRAGDNSEIKELAQQVQSLVGKKIWKELADQLQA